MRGYLVLAQQPGDRSALLSWLRCAVVDRPTFRNSVLMLQKWRWWRMNMLQVDTAGKNSFSCKSQFSDWVFWLENNSAHASVVILQIVDLCAVHPDISLKFKPKWEGSLSLKFLFNSNFIGCTVSHDLLWRIPSTGRQQGKVRLKSFLKIFSNYNCEIEVSNKNICDINPERLHFFKLSTSRPKCCSLMLSWRLVPETLFTCHSQPGRPIWRIKRGLVMKRWETLKIPNIQALLRYDHYIATSMLLQNIMKGCGTLSS